MRVDSAQRLRRCVREGGGNERHASWSVVDDASSWRIVPPMSSMPVSSVTDVCGRPGFAERWRSMSAFFREQHRWSKKNESPVP